MVDPTYKDVGHLVCSCCFYLSLYTVIPITCCGPFVSFCFGSLQYFVVFWHCTIAYSRPFFVISVLVVLVPTSSWFTLPFFILISIFKVSLCTRALVHDTVKITPYGVKRGSLCKKSKILLKMEWNHTQNGVKFTKSYSIII